MSPFSLTPKDSGWGWASLTWIPIPAMVSHRPLLRQDSPHEELLGAGDPQEGEEDQEGLHGGWEQSLSPEDGQNPLGARGSLRELLTRVVSAVPAASAATNRAGRKGSREPKCLLYLAKSTQEQPN